MKKNNKNRKERQIRDEKKNSRRIDEYTVPNPMIDAEMPMRGITNKYFI